MVTKLHFINRIPLPFQADLLVAGAHCTLSTNSEEILASVSRWRSHRPHPERSFALDVLLDPCLRSHRDLKLQTHFRGVHHLVFATIGDHEVFSFDLARKRVVGAVSLTTAADQQFWNAHWLPITVGVMGTTVGVVPLHSACLEFNGRGLLLAGPSGAGKSTLSVALARCGFSLISDDWTYISRQASCGDAPQLTAHGLSAPVKLLPDAVRYFPELASQAPKQWFNGEVAFELAPEEICQAPAKSTSRPHWLFFLERTSTPGCEFTPCSSVETRNFFERSAEKLPLQLPELVATRSATIDAVANCESWCVRFGDSPQATAEAIARFCQRN